jgi:hypothetical protein
METRISGLQVQGTTIGQFLKPLFLDAPQAYRAG